MHRRVGLGALCVALAVGCAPDPGADGSPAPGGPVVARVDGQPVTEAQLRAASGARPRRSAPVDWNEALESFVTSGIIEEELRRRGLHESERYSTSLEAIDARARRAEHELARSTLVSDIEAGLEFTEEELRARYDEQRERFLTTRMRLRQITVPDRETIRDIQGRVVAGEDFALIAAQANLDPALRRSSGDTGWIEQRRMPTALIGPAHRLLEPGEVSEPFQDREGRWNLVQLIAREKAVRREFEPAKHQLERELRVIRSREILAKLVEERRPGVDARLETTP